MRVWRPVMDTMLPEQPLLLQEAVSMSISQLHSAPAADAGTAFCAGGRCRNGRWRCYTTEMLKGKDELCSLTNGRWRCYTTEILDEWTGAALFDVVVTAGERTRKMEIGRCAGDPYSPR